MKIRMAALPAILPLVACCIKAPELRRLQDTWLIERGYDETWDAAKITLAKMGFSVARSEDKEAGIIHTDPAALSDNMNDWWDCKKLSWCQDCRGHRGRVTVLLRRLGNSQTEIKVISHFEILYSDDQFERLTKPSLHTDLTVFDRPCVSTGKFETDYFKGLTAMLKI